MSIHVKMQIDYKFNERIAMLSGVQMQSQAPTFVSYIRVSTGKQHQSGLGEEAQRIAVANYIASKKCVFRTNVTGDFGIVTEDFGPS